MAKRRWRLSQQNIAIIVIALIAIAIGLWVTEDYWRPAEVLPYLDTYETVTLTFSDERSGEILNPVVTLKGVDYTVKKTATGGSAEFTAVPRGTYTVETKLAGIYDETFSRTIQSTTKDISMNFTLDNIGTFSWAETPATVALTPNENDQVVVLRVYLSNSAKDTVLKNVRVKLEAEETHPIATIDDLECTSHSFEEDDLTAEKWIISGLTIGDIEGEATITVTYRITLDVGPGGADNDIVFTVSIQDLDGDSPETSASKTITMTAS